MKRAGFTMIELIFVIVILGILSAVALPKLLEVKEQASEGVVKSFVGTLNRTVAPAKWSKSLMENKDGSITDYNITTADTDFPSDFNASKGIDTAQCFTGNTVTATSNTAAKTKDGNYYLVCRDGNATTAPKFWYVKKAKSGTSITITSDKESSLVLE
jgi:prepilin-type N-terminal cleavage/methylation domain-containing protein